MHDVPLLVAVSIALAYALVGGLVARRVGLPTIVGYLLAGAALGPLTPGLVGDPEILRQLAEFGVILLMFGVGLHFSFRDLWDVRRVAVPGAIAQLALITVLGYGLGQLWGFSTGGAWVFGLALSVASTVVQMRGLMDYGWLDTSAGRVAIGWLIFEDLITVVVLVLLPVIFARGDSGGPLMGGLAVLKALGFVALMLLVGNKIVPWILGLVVRTRSRELFVLVALTVALGTALGSAAFFGVSLALGAFVAGVVVSESPFSHQIGADLLPFREAFAVIFFVTIGMLVDPGYIVAYWDRILAVSFVIVVVKGLLAGAITALLPASGHTALVLAAGRGQIGEFSFIVAQAGLALGLITTAQNALIVTSAIVSITVNTLIMRLVGPAERGLERRAGLWRWLNRQSMPTPPDPGTMTGHVVIVGCGRVGRHIAEALGELKIPRLVVEVDPSRLEKLVSLGVPVLFGDASNSEILDHAGLEHARALVVTLPDDTNAMTVVAAARQRAPHVPVIARASTWHGARQLREQGVDDIVRPELEGGLEIVQRTLLGLNMPAREVQQYTDLVRREGLDEAARPSAERTRMLDELMHAMQEVEVGWMTVAPDSPLAGVTLKAARLRQTAGVSVVAIKHNGQVVSNPGPDDALAAGDEIAVIGTPAQLAAMRSGVAGAGGAAGESGERRGHLGESGDSGVGLGSTGR